MLRRIGNSGIFKPFLGALLTCALSVSAAYSQELSANKVKSEAELEQLQSEIVVTQAKREELAKEIESLDKDRATLNRNLIEASTKSRKFENRIGKAVQRLSQLRDEQVDVNVSLNGKKALLAEVLGALQRMGRKPPPALLVTPEDALSSVRSSILLGSVVPEVRSETEILIGQLKSLVRISKDIESQKEGLTRDLAKLAQEEERLNLLLREKQKRAGDARQELAQESAKAAELAAKATSLGGLISQLEEEIESVRLANEAARIAEEKQKAIEDARIESARAFAPDEVFSDAGRIAPAIGFNKAQGLLPLPVAGIRTTGFGKTDSDGIEAKGVSFQTRQNSRVVAPADAWVLYAGPFRSYGQLLILNAGNGYHIVLAGMDRINVQPGQFVLLGEPIGRMGSKRIASTGTIDVDTTKPSLYVEFRKDGQSINPDPWWSENNLERTSDGS